MARAAGDDDDLIVSEARLHAPTTIEILGAYIPLPGDLKRYNEEVRQALGQSHRRGPDGGREPPDRMTERCDGPPGPATRRGEEFEVREVAEPVRIPPTIALAI